MSSHLLWKSQKIRIRLGGSATSTGLRPPSRGLHALTPATPADACSNTVVVCAYRGAGRPEAAYLLERLVDAAARELGMSPVAASASFRKRRPLGSRHAAVALIKIFLEGKYGSYQHQMTLAHC